MHTKHTKVDYHFVHKNFARKRQLGDMRSEDQVADFLTDGVSKNHLSAVFSKLGIVNMYAQLEGEC